MFWTKEVLNKKNISDPRRRDPRLRKPKPPVNNCDSSEVLTIKPLETFISGISLGWKKNRRSGGQKLFVGNSSE
uniref:Uncharacterized protein n=1 Tax=Haemonchus contortus TaxID=6289 RepID=W6NFY3_HAECO